MALETRRNGFPTSSAKPVMYSTSCLSDPLPEVDGMHAHDPERHVRLPLPVEARARQPSRLGALGNEAATGIERLVHLAEEPRCRGPAGEERRSSVGDRPVVQGDVDEIGDLRPVVVSHGSQVRAGQANSFPPTAPNHAAAEKVASDAGASYRTTLTGRRVLRRPSSPRYIRGRKEAWWPRRFASAALTRKRRRISCKRLLHEGSWPTSFGPGATGTSRCGRRTRRRSACSPTCEPLLDLWVRERGRSAPDVTVGEPDDPAPDQLNDALKGRVPRSARPR